MDATFWYFKPGFGCGPGNAWNVVWLVSKDLALLTHELPYINPFHFPRYASLSI